VSVTIIDILPAADPFIDVVVESQIFVDVVSGETPGVASIQPFRLGHTWGLVGDVTALTVLPSIFIPFGTTQSAKLVGIRTKLGSGTSIDVQLKRNGTNLGSVITVIPTAVTTTFNQSLAANDELTLVLSSPVGSPTHLTVTLFVEHTP